MQESRASNLSAERLEALLDALGLSDGDEPKNPYDSPPLVVHLHRHKPSFSKTDSVVLDDARAYLSDIVWSDLDEDSSDYEDTLPSRPGSSLDSFEVVSTPRAKPLSPISQQVRRPLNSTDIATSSPHVKPLHLQHAAVPLRSMTGTAPPLPSPSPSMASFISNGSFDSSSSCPHSSPSDAIYIKAAFNASIIMLRTPRSISLVELRKRLYEKFVIQEGNMLSHNFTVVSVAAPTAPSTPTTPTTMLSTPSSPTHPRDRSRWYSLASSSFSAIRPSASRSSLRSRASSSASTAEPVPIRPTLGPRRVSFAERTEMSFIDSDEAWARVLSSCSREGSKITLRILDTSA